MYSFLGACLRDIDDVLPIMIWIVRHSSTHGEDERFEAGQAHAYVLLGGQLGGKEKWFKAKQNSISNSFHLMEQFAYHHCQVVVGIFESVKGE